MGSILTYAFAGLVILVISLLTLVLLADEFKETYFSVADKATCKQSVKANSVLCLKGMTPSDIKCQTINLPIKDKNENIIKEKLAKSLFDCWDQFNKGDSEICGGSGIYCSICHYIAFENKDIKINDFSEYLATKNIPSGSITYSEYLTGKRTLGSDYLKEKEKKGVSDILDTSVEDNYATVFVQIKGKDQIQNYLKKAKYSAPGYGIIALGIGVFKVGAATTGIFWWTGGGLVAGIYTQIVGGLIIVGGALYAMIASYFVEVPFDTISYVYFGPYNAEALIDLGCEILPAQQS